MTVPEPYASRLKALRRDMEDAQVHALLITRPENRRYLSGYTAADTQIDESSGFLLITPNRQWLFTDFRYRIQAEKDAAGFDVRIYQANPAQTLGDAVRKSRVKNLGFEEDFLTVRFHRLLKKNLIGIQLTAKPGLVENLRKRKDPLEVKRIVRALRVTEAALADTLGMMKPGVSEIETARFLEETMRRLGAESPAFESIVAAGANAALPHAEPSKRRIKEGETVIIDCGAKVNGYRADITRTIVLGRPRSWIPPVYGVVRQAQLAGIKAIEPGNKTDAVDKAARDIIAAAGYGPQFGHALGHGVGLATHEAPSLSQARPSVLEPGMIVTVEPGIYLKNRGGIRLEEMVLVGDDGAKVLNRDRNFYDRW